MVKLLLILVATAGIAAVAAGQQSVFRTGTRVVAVYATVQDGADPRDAAAYVLTNGHCPDFPGANEVIINRPAPAK